MKSKIVISALLAICSIGSVNASPYERALGIDPNNSDPQFYNPSGKKIEIYPGIWSSGHNSKKQDKEKSEDDKIINKYDENQPQKESYEIIRGSQEKENVNKKDIKNNTIKTDNNIENKKEGVVFKEDNTLNNLMKNR